MKTGCRHWLVSEYRGYLETGDCLGDRPWSHARRSCHPMTQRTEKNGATNCPSMKVSTGSSQAEAGWVGERRAGRDRALLVLRFLGWRQGRGVKRLRVFEHGDEVCLFAHLVQPESERVLQNLQRENTRCKRFHSPRRLLTSKVGSHLHRGLVTPNPQTTDAHGPTKPSTCEAMTRGKGQRAASHSFRRMRA